MAKGGLNLNPGANPTLVAAATAAGSAMKLPDYSETFQAAADSYHKSMMASADMWGEIAEAAGVVVEAMAKDAAGPEKSKDAQNLYDNPAFEEIKNQMEENRKSIFKNSPGNPFNWGNEEAKTNYKEAVKIQNDLNAKLEHMAQNVTLATNSYKINPKTGLTFVDTEKMQKANLFGLQINHALQRTLEGNTTDMGMSLKVQKNADGDDRFYLYHDPTKIKQESYKPIAGLPELGGGGAGVDAQGRVLGEDGEPLNFSADEIAQMNILRNPNLLTNMNNDINRMRNLGGNSKTGSFTNYEQNVSTTMARNYSKNPGAWTEQTFFGDSFFEEVTGTGTGTSQDAPISVEMFNALGKVPGIFDGVKDTDDVEGPSIGDFQNADNMKALQLNLFNPGDGNYKKENTAKIFEEWYNNKMTTVFDDGFKAGPNYKSKEHKGDPLSLDMYYDVNGTSVLGQNITNRFNKFAKGIEDSTTSFKSYDGKTTFTPNENGSWTITGPTTDNPTPPYTSSITSQENIADLMGFENYRNRLGVREDYTWTTSATVEDVEVEENIEATELLPKEEGSISTGWGMGTKTRTVRKVGGIWYVKKEFYFGQDPENKGWDKASGDEIKIIKQKYK